MRKFLMFPGTIYNNHFYVWLSIAMVLIIFFLITTVKIKKNPLWLLAMFGEVQGATDEDINFIRKATTAVTPFLIIAAIAGIAFRFKRSNPSSSSSPAEVIILGLIALIYLASILLLFIFSPKYIIKYIRFLHKYTPVEIKRYENVNSLSAIRKQKIFFCAYDTDYEQYMPILSDEIFKNHKNVEIVHLKRPEYPTKGYDKALLELALYNMQLIMFPVTSDLLSKDNIVVNHIIPFAQENNIPLLPFAFENGLEEDFNKVCGDIQLMSKYGTEAEMAVFEDKLEKFLTSILYDDSLLKQIRDAFSAYIFLSYRRTDKEYAKEIMHLIHENALCRDVAIWYDEFLVPGEHFNEAIQEACRKSSLFAMVVTPNILQKPNYVMDIEYPFAVKHDKKILPIIAQAIKTKTLSNYFKDIPTPVEAGEALNQELNIFFQSLNQPDANEDPTHLFFIALAYLSGIDVEKDVNRAIILLKESAQKGCLDAYKKLISIYYSGNGVSKNLILAAKTQEEYCKVLELKGNTEPEYYSECRLELYRLAELYDELDDQDKLECTIEWLNDVIKKTPSDNSDDLDYSSIFDISYSAYLLGKNLVDLNQIDRAKEQLDIAIEYGRKLLSHESLNITYLYLSFLEESGRIDVISGHNDTALQKYKECLRIIEKKIKNSNYKTYISMCNAYQGMGIATLDDEHIDESEKYFATGMEYLKKAGIDPDNPLEYEMYMAVLISFIGDVALIKDDIDTAIQKHKEAKEKYLEIYSHKQDLEMRKRIVYQTCKLASDGYEPAIKEAKDILTQFESEYPDHIIVEACKEMLENS